MHNAAHRLASDPPVKLRRRKVQREKHRYHVSLRPSLPPSLASFPPRCPLGALISTLGAPSLRAGRKEGRKWVSFTHESVGHFEIRFWKTLGDGGGSDGSHGTAPCTTGELFSLGSAHFDSVGLGVCAPSLSLSLKFEQKLSRRATAE